MTQKDVLAEADSFSSSDYHGSRILPDIGCGFFFTNGEMIQI